jgi:predicted ribosomally synthesized peptide with SipW-like signal peptide
MTIGLVASVIGVGTYAFFSDTETSTGNSMAAGVLDLKVAQGNDWVDNPGILVTIADMKPSKIVLSDPIYLQIVDNPGKVWKMVTAVSCETNGQPEPELEKGDTTNYLPNVTEFAMEVNDGGWSTPVLMPTMLDQWMSLGRFEKLTPIKVEQSFHMVSTAGNEYQSDKCTFNETFLVTQDNDPWPGQA